MMLIRGDPQTAPVIDEFLRNGIRAAVQPEIGVVGEKPIDLVLIFLGFERTGRVDDGPSFTDKHGGRVEKHALYLRQPPDIISRPDPSRFGMTVQYPGRRTGSIKKYLVENSREGRVGSVADKRIDVPYIHPPRRFHHLKKPFKVDFACTDRP